MITFSAFGILQLRQAKHYCSFLSLSLRKLTVTEACMGGTWGTFRPLDQISRGNFETKKLLIISY